MTKNRPFINLSCGQYDELENRLSQFLGLKILLIRDWNPPKTCHYKKVDGEFILSSDDPAVQALTILQSQWNRDHFNYLNGQCEHPGEEPGYIARRESLHAYLQERDPALSHIDDAELDSVLKQGHITLRQNNAQPPHTVIVFDTNFNDPAEKQRWLIGLQDFDDIYHPEIDSHGKIPLSNFLENADIDPDQARSYETLRRVRYALRHQNEHDNYDRGWWFTPFAYNFANLNERTSWGIGDIGSGHGFEHYKDMYAGDYAIFINSKSTGVDFGFRDKIVVAGALSEIKYMSISPMRTIARLAANRDNKDAFDGFNLGRVCHFQQTLYKTMERECQNRLLKLNWAERQGHFHHIPDDDFRLLIPVFREMHKNISGKKRWTPEGQKPVDINAAETLYLNTLWKAAETHLPALAHAPLPVITIGGNLPKSAAGYRKPQGAHPAPKPV